MVVPYAQNRVAARTYQRTPMGPSLNTTASTQPGVGGWALCVECLLRALLALSASLVVPRRTSRGLAGPCKHSTHSGHSQRKTGLVPMSVLRHQYLCKRQTRPHSVVVHSEAVVILPITEGTHNAWVHSQQDQRGDCRTSCAVGRKALQIMILQKLSGDRIDSIRRQWASWLS